MRRSAGDPETEENSQRPGPVMLTIESLYPPTEGSSMLVRESKGSEAAVGVCNIMLPYCRSLWQNPSHRGCLCTMRSSSAAICIHHNAGSYEVMSHVICGHRLHFTFYWHISAGGWNKVTQKCGTYQHTRATCGTYQIT
jgi:hypothetical protein